MKQIVRFGFSIVMAFCIFSGSMWAQTSFGTIFGTVTDETGAVIPGVMVRVTNQDTGVSRTTVSTDSGNYEVASLNPGVYVVEAELAGFKKFNLPNVRVRVGESPRVDIALQVGEITEVLTIEGVPDLLETKRSTVGTVTSEKEIQELPLNGRNFVQLTLLTPGATTGVNSGGFFVAGGASPSVSGNRSDNNNFTLDGVNNNETFFKFEAIHPNVDAIQEFKVQTNVTSAQSGAAAGANVNVATKSGTNEIHGTVYAFHRNDNLDARNFFARGKQEFRWNQFGATVGGPIIRDKSFFFFAYEGLRLSEESNRQSVVPTPEQLSGNLALDHTGAPAPLIFDPLTTREDPNNPGQFIRDPFPGNQIPQSRINPISAAYAAMFYPTPNQPGEPFNNVNANPFIRDDNQYIVRFDHTFSEVNSLFVRYADERRNLNEPVTLQTVTRERFNDFENLVISDTHLFSPTFIMDAKFGWNEDDIAFSTTAPSPGTQALFDAGLTGVPPTAGRFDFPVNLNISGVAGTDQSVFISGPQQTAQWTANFMKVIGKHTVNAGFDVRHQQMLHDGPFANWAFDSVPTADPQNLGTTGQSLASFLLGLPSAADRILGEEVDVAPSSSALAGKRQLWHFYVQDDFNITTNLTINLGLRYEYSEWFAPRFENPGLSGFDFNFNPHDPDPNNRGRFFWTTTNPITGEPPNVRETFIEPDRNNIAPRIGFAYRLGEETTLRAGYGIFYDSNFTWETSQMRGNWPYAAGQNLQINRIGGELRFLNNVFPTADLTQVTPAAQHTAHRFQRVPYMQQWNLNIQHMLAEDLLLDIGYVGNKGTKLPSFLNANTAPPGPGEVEPRRPFPKAGGAVSENQSIANSSYNSLQIKLEKEFSGGLTFLSSYAYSRAIDLNSQFGGRSPQNPDDIKASYGLSDFHSTNIYSLSWVYELPFGQGRSWGGNWSPAMDAILGGWMTTGIFSTRDGRPYTVGLPFDNANIGARSNATRPDLVGDPDLSNPDPRRWFNTGAFAAPEPFTLGNLGKNTEIGPGRMIWDLGIYKNFAVPSVSEEFRIQFRTEFFNAFNRANFGQPGAAFGTGSFGVIGSAEPGRRIQFALKIYY